jgi:hypothetical protein
VVARFGKERSCPWIQGGQGGARWGAAKRAPSANPRSAEERPIAMHALQLTRAIVQRRAFGAAAVRFAKDPKVRAPPMTHARRC